MKVTFALFMSKHKISLIFVFVMISGYIAFCGWLFLTNSVVLQVHKLLIDRNLKDDNLGEVIINLRYLLLSGYIIMAFVAMMSILIIIKKIKKYDKMVFNESDRKKLEEELVREAKRADDANQVRAQFLANMSHEIRTPLSGILGMAELMKDPKTTEADRLNFSNIISSSGKNLLFILNDILDLSKIDAGKIEFEKEVFCPERIICETIKLFLHSVNHKKIKLTSVFDEVSKQYFKSDQYRIRQVLSNLLNNSIKFTKEGEIIVRARIEASTYDHHFYYLVVEVADTGIGISQENQQKIFQNFTQAESTVAQEFGGSGLGLSIAKKVCQLMGGDVKVESSVGQGSVFCFNVLVEKMPEREKAKINAIQKINIPVNSLEIVQKLKLRILVAEDNEINALIVGKYLNSFGHFFDRVDNGLFAFEENCKNKYDLILMDCQMPKMDGYEATQLIRQWESQYQKSRTPIYALTAAVFPDEIERCYSSGMDKLIRKPINRNAFQSTINDLVEEVICLKPLF